MGNRLKIACLVCLCPFVFFAQLQVKNFFNLTGKKDVPVNTICQDKAGYLYLGTNNGLYKFDGKSATELHKESRLLKKAITALFIDRNKTTWIGTNEGMIYRLFADRIDSLNLLSYPNSSRITSFAELDSGICIGTYGNGIYTVLRGKLNHFNKENGLSDDVVYTIESNGKDRLWCATDAGITEIKHVYTKPVIRIISDHNGLPDNIVRDIVFQNNRLLVSMQDSGFCYFDLVKNRFRKNLQKQTWAKGTIVNAVEPMPGKQIIATEKNGLIEIMQGETREYDYPTYIGGTSINGMFTDNAGQLWLASKKGISHFIEKRFNLISSIKGLTDQRILAIACSRNAIWVGTNMGVSILENGPGTTMAMGASHDISKFTISCAVKAPDGNIWYGSYGNGIIIMEPSGEKPLIINSHNSKLANDNISNIFFADQNIIYISTLGGGLVKAELVPGNKMPLTILKTFTEDDGLGNSYVYSAITDNKGRLFVASDGGGLQLLENGKFTNLIKKPKFKSNTVFSLCLDKFNTIWATSNADGILKYSGDSLLAINEANGLRDLQPQQIIAVDNILYAFNSKGVDKINCVDNAVSYYDLFENDLEPNLNAVCYANGKIISGTNSGILIFRTDIEQLDSIKPTAFIKELQVNFKPFPIDSVHEFKYKQNSFAITFGGIWLKNPDKLLFRYRLKGLEDNWQQSNEGMLVNYNNLEPGQYTFLLQSKNEEDVWSEPVEYSFTILSPLWKRWWFWLLVIGGGSLGIYAIFRYRIKSLQRENLLLEQRVAERTSEIEAQSRIIEAKNTELEQLSLVASKTDNVVLILDPDGRLEYVNESFLNINNTTLEDLRENIGETIYELSNHPNIREIINDAITNRRSVHYESINARVSNGRQLWGSSTLTPIFDEEGNLKKIIIIDTDVSEIKKQEQIITQKNKDITDSISYARKIQHSILPRESVIKTHLPKSFVLYMTKDIVSGDFYWFAHFNTYSIIAAVDCTGHGVPGAFMSLIGYSLLNRIINEKKITEPSEILLELNNGVLGILHKNESESKDGMDIAICKINHAENTVEYAGAMRPLWIVSEGVLTEIKADKIPIGTKQKDRDLTISYTTHTITAKPGDAFYIFTDGYSDQFGGAKDKKYSTGRFKDLLIKSAGLSYSLQEKNMREEHLNWKGPYEQVDDILLIGFTL